MTFTECEYTGDTSSSGSTKVIFIMPEAITEPNDGTQLKSKYMFEKTCKKCGDSFDSLKKKSQICPECKRKRK